MAVSFPENEACDFILDEMDSILDDSNRCSYVAKQPISEFQAGLVFKYLSAMASLFYKQA